jgi:hypothetical protein
LVFTWLSLGFDAGRHPALTAALGLIVLALAVGTSLVFERSAFCRYGCPIGRVIGTYALLSPIELRARDRAICQHNCKTRDCYFGNERGAPCPTGLYLGSLDRNSYCLFCTECLRACPHDNVALRLRPFGDDLRRLAGPKIGAMKREETVFALAAVAATALFALVPTAWWRELAGRSGPGDWAAVGVLLVVTGLAMASAYGIAAGAVAILSRPEGELPRKLGRHAAFALLPIALFHHVARDLAVLIAAAGGLPGTLAGPGVIGAPPLTGEHALPRVQVALLIAGLLWSIYAARQITALHYGRRPPLRAWLPTAALATAYALFALWTLA